MGNLNPIANASTQALYQQLVTAAQDQRLSPEEQQNLRTTAEASGDIDHQEALLLQQASSMRYVSLEQGKAKAAVDIHLFATAPTSDLSGQSIGHDEKNRPITLGKTLAKDIETEKEALALAHRRGHIFDKPDTAVVQNTRGLYELYDIRRPHGKGLKNDHDFNGYHRLRAAQFKHPGALGDRLIAVVSEDKQARYMGQESSPARYATIANPAPLLPANAPIALRQESVQHLREQALKVLQRLETMEQDLGLQKDHRGVFSAMYRVITERGVAELDRFIAQGDLRAAEFEGALLINFANRYFAAYDAYAAGDMAQVPEVWRSAFDGGRNAESQGYPKASVTEIVTSSMIAHIINDLPQTLQDIGYPEATDRQTLDQVYDSFNGALMEEKAHIMNAVSTHYGHTDMHVLDNLALHLLTPHLKSWGQQASQRAQGEVFTLMRTLAKQRALSDSPTDIQHKAQGISDAARILTPGGN